MRSIFQNVSSTFAQFIGGAKGDIRISQPNTFFTLQLFIKFSVSNVLYLYITTIYQVFSNELR